MSKVGVRMSFALFCYGLLAVSAKSLTAISDRVDAQKLRGGSRLRMLPLASEDASGITEEPRVFFLFLTMAGIEQQELWEAFFDQQPTHRYRVFVHCKNSCALSLEGNKLKATQVETVPSTYCTDLVTPMVQLLQSAVEESVSTHDKFVFVSESTLPVKPFSDVYTSLTSSSDSDFCIYPTDHWNHLPLGHNHSGRIVKHSQWVILNQAHANIMVQKWPATKAGFSSPAWSMPVFNERHKGPWGQVQNQAGKMPLPTCMDEFAFFSTIFGALVDDGGRTQISQESMPGYGGQPLQLQRTNVLQGICQTFAFWDAPEIGMSSLVASLVRDFPNTKFTCGTSSVVESIVSVPSLVESLVRDPVCKGSHPATFTAISDMGAAALRRSSYLFARKIPENVLSADQFKRILLSATESFAAADANTFADAAADADTFADVGATSDAEAETDADPDTDANADASFA